MPTNDKYGLKIGLGLKEESYAPFAKSVQEAVRKAQKETAPVQISYELNDTKSMKDALASSIKKEINRVTTELSNSGKTISIKNVKVALDDESTSGFQATLDKKEFKITVNKIDATKAVNAFRDQLTTMLSGLSITGLKDFLGTDGVSDVYVKHAAEMEAAYTKAIENNKKREIDAAAEVARIKSSLGLLEDAKKDVKKIGDIGFANNQLKDINDLIVMFERAKSLTGDALSVELNSLEELLFATRAAIKEKIALEDAAKKTADADKKATDEAAKAAKEQTAASAKAAKEREAAQQKYQAEIKKTITEVGKLETEIAKLGDADNNIDLQTEVSHMLDQLRKWSSGDMASDQERRELDLQIAALRTKIELRKKSAKAAKDEHDEAIKGASKELTLEQRALNMKTRIISYIQKNTRAYRANKEEFDGMLDALNNKGDLTDEILKKIGIRLSNIQLVSKQAGLEGLSFMEMLSAGYQALGGLSLANTIISESKQLLRDMYMNVVAVDDAMTELRKVTDLTAIGYRNARSEAAAMAQEIGTGVAESINATADFARLGFTVPESQDLAQAALVYKSVGDGINDISFATESLISTTKAFGLEASDAMHIVDAFNEVGRRNLPTIKVAITVKTQRWTRPWKDLIFVV